MVVFVNVDIVCILVMLKEQNKNCKASYSGGKLHHDNILTWLY